MKNYCHFVVEPLTKSEELGLAKKAAGGDKQARETLIRANIKYALSYAKTFYGHGLSNEDVDDEAVIGLIKAIDHFDYSKGTKIITLAKIYIMNEIMHASNCSGYVPRQSDDRLRMILKINKAMKKLNPDISQKERIEQLSAKTGFSKKVISEFFEESLPCVSLDSKTGDCPEDSMLSTIADDSSYTPEETAVYHLQKQELYENLEKLDPLEKQIICMFYGLQNYKKTYSLSEIGSKLNVTKQYVFNIKERALNKLKKNMLPQAA